jgi:hypothetical protein
MTNPGFRRLFTGLSNFNSRNILYIPAVEFFAFLNLGQNCLCPSDEDTKKNENSFSPNA